MKSIFVLFFMNTTQYWTIFGNVLSFSKICQFTPSYICRYVMYKRTSVPAKRLYVKRYFFAFVKCCM
jgi:hypothetical protein